MSENNTYKLKYYKYKNKYNTLKQQQGGILTHTPTHDVYTSHDSKSHCDVNIQDMSSVEGGYGIVYKCENGRVVKNFKYDHDDEDSKYTARCDCLHEYNIMRLLKDAIGVAQIIGHDCYDDAHKFLIEYDGGSSFTHFTTLSNEQFLLVREYIKTAVSELLRILWSIHYIYNIIHGDTKFANILFRGVRNNSKTYGALKIADFGLSSKYRNNTVVFDTDPDKTHRDIKRCEFNNIPYVVKYGNTGTHTSIECIPPTSIFEKDAILSYDIRRQSDCRHIYAVGDIYPTIAQSVHIVLRINTRRVGGEYIDLYNPATVTEEDEDMKKKLKDEIRYRQFDIKDGLVCLKTEPGKRLYNYDAVYSHRPHEHVSFLEQAHKLINEMAGGKITSLPIKHVHDQEKAFGKMQEIVSVFNQPPRPFIQISEHTLNEIGIQIHDVAHIPDDQIVTDTYDYMTRVPIIPDQYVSKTPPRKQQSQQTQYVTQTPQPAKPATTVL